MVVSDSLGTPWTVAAKFLCYGISQARILEWVVISFSRESSQKEVEHESPALAGGFFTTKLPGKPELERTIRQNAGLEETQAGSKIAGRNINNFRYADDTTLMAESEEELKSLLMKVKVESEKVGLKLNIQKIKVMASNPITSWEIDGETVETVSDFILGGSKITADGDCSHEIKRLFLVGRKVMTNLDSIFRSRD